MEKRKVKPSLMRLVVALFILAAIAGASFAFGLAWSSSAHAAEGGESRARGKAKVIYPEKTELDFEGLKIEGELRNPGEFYFQHRNEDKFDSLVKRRKNFHRELLRDAVMGK